MNTNEKQNPVARAIVANLAWRARRAQQESEKVKNLEWHSSIRVYADAQAEEAWDAYATSKKILLEIEP